MRAIAISLVLSVGLLGGAGEQIVAPPCPGCQRTFDGRTWDGWEHDPQNWTIVDGAMRGFGSGVRSAFTKTDYGSFRLIVTSRMAPAVPSTKTSSSKPIRRRTPSTP